MFARLHTAVVVLALAAGSPAMAETSPGHQVDAAIDLIVGSENAPHELIVYFSPGCPLCIVYHSQLRDQLERGVSEDRLRIVYRLVPQFYHRAGDVVQVELAGERSDWMARWLQCRFSTGGAEDFETALSVFIRYAMASNRGFERGPADWPAVPKLRFYSFQELLRERGVYLDPMQERCNPERAAQVFARNLVLLDHTAGDQRARYHAPMLIIDGDWLDERIPEGPLSVFTALEWRIFHMDRPE